MEKINQINFNQAEYVKAKKQETPEGNDNININDLPKNSIEEAIGRSQVNFRGGKSELLKLTLEDKKLIDVLEKVFRLDKEEAKSIEDYTKEFLQKFKMKSLTSMKSDDIFEHVEDQACWVENISKKLDLSDFESTDLGWILTAHINAGDITKFKNHLGKTIMETSKYTRDYTPFENVMERNGLDSDETVKIFHSLSEFAQKYDSIFDMFKKDAGDVGDKALSAILKNSGASKDKIADILIDMHSLAGKSMKERVRGINIHAAEEAFNNGINAIVTANEISKKFNLKLTRDLIDMLDGKISDTKTLQETAYMITDKYNLPTGAYNDIVNIIKTNCKLNDKEISVKFIEVLQKNSGKNIEMF